MNLWQLIPIAMVFVACALFWYALLIITARADRRWKEMQARENLKRALTPDPQIMRKVNRWN